jgi:ABC-type multidrug transport system ATPase subunit
MISINGIYKSFKETSALDNINIEIGKGELFGLIGPDGAGKTTLFRILTTLMLPDRGEAIVGNYDIIKDMKKIRQNVGYMPGKFSLYLDLSVEENIHFFATIFGTTLEENYDIIKDIYIQLEPFKNRRAGQLSGGMKQKLALCCALVHRPEVLFLDEPTTGVDAVSRQEFWEILKDLKNRGITTLVSTPYMDEASLCDRIALINQGKILSIDTPKGIVRLFDKPLYQVVSNQYYQCLQDLRQFPYAIRVLPFGEFLHVTMEKEVSEKDLISFLTDKNHEQLSVSRIVPTVEDVFLHLLNKEDHVDA